MLRVVSSHLHKCVLRLFETYIPDWSVTRWFSVCSSQPTDALEAMLADTDKTHTSVLEAAVDSISRLAMHLDMLVLQISYYGRYLCSAC